MLIEIKSKIYGAEMFNAATYVVKIKLENTPKTETYYLKNFLDSFCPVSLSPDGEVIFNAKSDLKSDLAEITGGKNNLEYLVNNLFKLLADKTKRILKTFKTWPRRHIPENIEKGSLEVLLEYLDSLIKNPGETPAQNGLEKFNPVTAELVSALKDEWDSAWKEFLKTRMKWEIVKYFSYSPRIEMVVDKPDLTPMRKFFLNGGLEIQKEFFRVIFRKNVLWT